MNPQSLYMYVIYDNPSDYPGSFVLVQLSIHSDSKGIKKRHVICYSKDFEVCLSQIPKEYVRIAPHSTDDKTIVGTWI